MVNTNLKALDKPGFMGESRSAEKITARY